MRKFYLLWGEWCYQQRLEESRFYKLICVHCKTPPDLKLFPFLDIDTEEEQEPTPESDVMNFQAITASLTPYQE